MASGNVCGAVDDVKVSKKKRKAEKNLIVMMCGKDRKMRGRYTIINEESFKKSRMLWLSKASIESIKFELKKEL